MRRAKSPGSAEAACTGIDRSKERFWAAASSRVVQLGVLRPRLFSRKPFSPRPKAPSRRGCAMLLRRQQVFEGRLLPRIILYWICVVRPAPRCTRAILHEFDESEKPFPLERKLKVGESSATHSERKTRRSIFAGSKCHQCTAACERNCRCIGARELLPVDKGDKRERATQCLGSVGHFPRYGHLMTGGAQRLNNSFDKRRVRRYH
jgi:hypothetical protein